MTGGINEDGAEPAGEEEIAVEAAVDGAREENLGDEAMVVAVGEEVAVEGTDGGRADPALFHGRHSR